MDIFFAVKPSPHVDAVDMSDPVQLYLTDLSSVIDAGALSFQPELAGTSERGPWSANCPSSTSDSTAFSSPTVSPFSFIQPLQNTIVPPPPPAAGDLFPGMTLVGEPEGFVPNPTVSINQLRLNLGQRAATPHSPSRSVSPASPAPSVPMSQHALPAEVIRNARTGLRALVHPSLTSSSPEPEVEPSRKRSRRALDDEDDYSPTSSSKKQRKRAPATVRGRKPARKTSLSSGNAGSQSHSRRAPSKNAHLRSVLGARDVLVPDPSSSLLPVPQPGSSTGSGLSFSRRVSSPFSVSPAPEQTSHGECEPRGSCASKKRKRTELPPPPLPILPLSGKRAHADISQDDEPATAGPSTKKAKISPPVTRRKIGVRRKAGPSSPSTSATHAHKCPICGKGFGRPHEKVRHMETTDCRFSLEVPADSKYGAKSCPWCPATYSRPDAVKRHMKGCKKNPARG